MGLLGLSEPLATRHDISQFFSSLPTLDAWLRGKARLNEARGGARTYVARDGDRVAGFCSLAASAVERGRMFSRVGRTISDPIPVILLGQLALVERIAESGRAVRYEAGRPRPKDSESEGDSDRKDG